jgi:hypothetical protein
MNAVLARVASWGKAKALSLDETRLDGGGMCGLWVGKGAGEGRQDTQDIEKDNGRKKKMDGVCVPVHSLLGCLRCFPVRSQSS